jgi:hypothetical protein
MRRHDLLRGLHEVLQPRTYFEIGVRDGLSLQLSRAQSVAVDPFYNVTREIRCDVHLVRTTSDEFFARRHPFAHFAEPTVDLAFIDGMHLSEFALRDFINTERFCHAGSVVVFDDMLPRNVIEAGRGREGSAKDGAWAGDVYKVVDTLRALRPDLTVLEMDTQPTGTLVVMNTDRRNRVLHEAYDRVVVDYVVPDPQVVPEWALQRTRAIPGEDLLSSPVLGELKRMRSRPDAEARPVIARALRRAGFLNHQGA